MPFRAFSQIIQHSVIRFYTYSMLFIHLHPLPLLACLSRPLFLALGVRYLVNSLPFCSAGCRASRVRVGCGGVYTYRGVRVAREPWQLGGFKWLHDQLARHG